MRSADGIACHARESGHPAPVCRDSRFPLARGLRRPKTPTISIDLRGSVRRVSEPAQPLESDGVCPGRHLNGITAHDTLIAPRWPWRPSGRPSSPPAGERGPGAPGQRARPASGPPVARREGKEVRLARRIMARPAARWRRSEPPGFVRPCEPALIDRPPAGPGWLHEVKHDGFRIIARNEGERVKVWSRRRRLHRSLSGESPRRCAACRWTRRSSTARRWCSETTGGATFMRS